MANTGGRRILVVDDDPALLRLLGLRLRGAGHTVETRASAAEALQILATFQPDLVITDLRMDDMDGIGLLDALHKRRPGLPVLIITAHGTIPDAVAATQQGAFGFLTKPIDKNDLNTQIARALRLSSAGESEQDWRAGIIARSPVMEELLAQVKLVAEAEASVLISGPSGAGKELIARALHKASARWAQPFIAVNCGAIPEQLLESELFGHQKGAFTGAIQNHVGLFQKADKGVLFLDEVGDMPLALQVKLLRVLQDKEIRAVGSTQVVPVDVRVISATHRDLEQAMQSGEFREDLYYRLNVVKLRLPSLSERRDDIPALVAFALERLAKRGGGSPKVYAPEAMELLVAADWPGNVRQLFNVVEQNVALSPAPVVSVRLVQNALGDGAGELPSYTEARDEFTRNYLLQLLQLTQGNVSQAARLAKRNRTELYKLLARHGVDIAAFKHPLKQ